MIRVLFTLSMCDCHFSYSHSYCFQNGQFSQLLVSKEASAIIGETWDTPGRLSCQELLTPDLSSHYHSVISLHLKRLSLWKNPLIGFKYAWRGLHLIRTYLDWLANQLTSSRSILVKSKTLSGTGSRRVREQAMKPTNGAVSWCGSPSPLGH